MPFKNDEVAQVKGEEFEFEGDDNENKKTPAVEAADKPVVNKTDNADDPAVVTLLGHAPYRNVIPPNAVWRVNIDMFHESFHAFSLGRLVAERFGNTVATLGSMISAALKLAAYRKHVLNEPSYEK